MPSTCCCVPLCKNRGGHRFPKDPSLRKEWLKQIRRIKWKPTDSSVVCFYHFAPKDYITSTWRGGNIPLKKTLQKTAVPSVFAWTKGKDGSETGKKRKERHDRRQLLLIQGGKDDGVCVPPVNSQNDFEVTDNICPFPIGEELEVSTTDHPHTATQTEEIGLQVKNVISTVSHFTQTKSKFVPYRIHNFQGNDNMLHYYTGLESYVKFLFVFYSLGPASYHLNYINSPPPTHLEVLDLFFLTMIILRRNLPYIEVSFMFSTSVSQVSNIFNTWIRFMYLQWQEVDIWPSKQLVKFHMPTDFKIKYPTTRLIIDSTECPIKKPSLPTAQQATFSSYKNRNTVKVLVGSTPGGLISYISQCYGGATSDRQMMERSDLLEKFHFGDSIMADKGFDIQDMLVPHGVTVNIPRFFKKMNRLPSETLRRDRKIASKRAHIERLIGLGKTYKILQSPMSPSHTSLSSEIIFICYMLCNFRRNIVGKDA